MSNYKDGKIYSVISTKGVYIGSTTSTLNRRLQLHKSALNQYKKGKRSYVSVFDIISCPKCKITLLENYPCDNRTQLLEREREWTDSMTCVNIRTCIRYEYEKQEYNISYRRSRKNL